MSKAAQIYAERTNPDSKVTGTYLETRIGMLGPYVAIGYEVETDLNDSGIIQEEDQMELGEYLCWLTEQLEKDN